MRTLTILVLALSLTSFDAGSYSKHVRWVVSENSSLIVNGRTNVSRFSCAVLAYPKTDTVVLSQDRLRKILLSGILNIDVKNFDCKNLLMTRQLRKTLKEDRFPFLQIRFVSLKETPMLSSVKGLVEISIAGVTKRFEINYQLSIDKNAITLTGNHMINFSDFNLVPPKKIGKLIQAKDELAVLFTLKMEPVS